MRQPPMRSEHLGQSFRHAFRGLWHAFRSQRNVRIHAAAAVLVLGAGILFGATPLELALIVLTIAMVIVAELINSALEAVVDLAAPYIDPLAGIAKDVAAAAVLLTALTAVVVGALILGPRLIALTAR
jgi:diacylglycerol kinase